MRLRSSPDNKSTSKSSDSAYKTNTIRVASGVQWWNNLTLKFERVKFRKEKEIGRQKIVHPFTFNFSSIYRQMEKEELYPLSTRII